MKVLMLSQGSTIEDQPDFDFAFRNAKVAGNPIGFRNIPFYGYARKHGWEAFFRHVLDLNEEFKPDVVFFQFFHGAGVESPQFCIQELKKAGNAPLVFGSVGDLFDTSRWGRWGRMPEEALVDLAKMADVMFATSMGNISNYFVSQGAKNIVFLPNAYCPVHFGPISDENATRTEYDVVMVGSIGISRKQILGTGIRAFERSRDAWNLKRCFGERFGLFGYGWPRWSGRKNVSFTDQVELFKRAKIVVDAQPPLRATYYSSDRVFFALGSGARLVMHYVPRFEKMFENRRQCHYVYSARQLIDVCKEALSLPNDVIVKYRQETLSLMRSRHTVSKRVDTILSVAEALMRQREGKLSSDEALNALRLWHFLPDVDLEEERNYAVANWKGISNS